jgi:hypothetical protein
LSDKDFKVKNKLVVNGLTGGAGPLVANSNKEIDSVAFLSTLQGGTGTTTSPSSGQVLYSASGTTYNPTTLNTLDVKGATYSADAPSSPVVGQIWVESDVDSDSFDPNIIRRKTFTATAAQTVFTTDVEFIQGYEQVFFNGMLLIRNSDYTTASNTNVTLAAGAAAGDIVEVVSITNLNSINAATTTTNTFTGNQIVNARIGIGASSPDAKLTVQESGDAQITLKNSSGATRAFIGTAGIVGSASTDDLRIRSDASNMIFAFSGFEKMRFSSSGSSVFGGIVTGTPPSTSKIYVNNGSNENIGNATWGGSLVINEYSTSLNSNIGLEFKTRADSNGSGWRLSSLANNPDFVFESRSSSATWTERMRINSEGNVIIGTGTDFGAGLTIQKPGTSFVPSTPYPYPSGRVFLALQSVAAQDNWFGFIPTYGTSSGSANLLLAVNNNNFSQTSGNYIGSEATGVSASHLAFGKMIGGSGGGVSATKSEQMRLNLDGYLLVGYTSSNGAFRVQVNSQIFATSSSIATSDGRYKDNVETITSGLNIVDSLRPVAFDWKEHAVHNFPEGKTVGFIAQEVQEALSDYEWVDNIIKTNYNEEADEEFLGIAESNIIPLLVAAVKELKARVETLEANNV